MATVNTEEDSDSIISETELMQTNNELNVSPTEVLSDSTLKLGKTTNPNESWTVVNPKKRPAKFVLVNTNKKFTIHTKNKYQALENEDVEVEQIEAKPPPIFIPGVLEFQTLINSINEVAKDEYSTKLIGKDQVKLQCTTSTDYRSIVKKLKDDETSFHTYQPKQEKKYRVVLRNLHYSTDINEIKQEIEQHGHKVANIHNIKHRTTKEPLSMFFIDLHPAENNKDIYNIKYLHYSTIQFESPHVKRQIVQCARCQRYGHTKAYCYRDPRCVKCGRNHLTIQCDKPENTAPTCALCKDSHPSNYRGCQVYRELQQRKYPTLRRRNIENFGKPIQQQFVQPGVSYAQITSENKNLPVNNKLEQMMVKLMERMDTMLNLLTTLVSKMK